MFCSNCGKQNPDGVRFCSGCGSAMTAEAPVAPVQPVVQEAPVQAAPVVPVQPAQPVQQPVYQAPVQPVQAAQVTAQPEPKKSKGKLIAVIIAIIVVIGIAAGGIFLFGEELGIIGGSKEESSQAGSNTQTGESNTNNGDASNSGNSVNNGNSNGSINVQNNNTPEAVARKYAESSLSYDASGLVDCMSELTLKEFSEMFFDTDVVDKSAIIAKLESTIPDEKVSFTLISVEVDEEWDEKESVLEVITDYDSSYASRVTDAVRVNVTYILEGEEEETDSVTCIKEDGNWKIYG